MSSTPAVTARSTPLLVQVLAQPWLDRTIAFIAMVPLLYLTYYRYQHMKLGVPLASFAFDRDAIRAVKEADSLRQAVC